jgi:plasmid replication initiation protein
MEPTRELDQLRVEVDRLHERTNASKVTLSALEASTDEKFAYVAMMLSDLKNELNKLGTSIESLESVAAEGRASIKTLLWVGGVAGSIIAFFAMLYGYVPK